MKIKFLSIVALLSFIILSNCSADELQFKVKNICAKIQSRYLARNSYSVLAIKYFKVLGDRDEQFELSNTVMKLLIDELSQFNNCQVLDIRLFNNALKNLGSQRAIRSREYFDVGRSLGADIIVSGTVFGNGIVNVSLHQVSNGKLVFSDNLNTSTGSKSEIGAVFRSLVCPGWGQFYVDNRAKGTLIMASEVGLMSTALIMNFVNHKTDDKINMSSSYQEKRHFYSQMTRSHQVHTVCMCALFTIWAYSIIDAHISAMSLSDGSIYSSESSKDGFRILAFNEPDNIVFRLQYSFRL